MEECLRKLSLWETKTFKPIMSHDDLEPIILGLGFVGLPPSSTVPAWKEYLYTARSTKSSSSSLPPRPRLPYPRVDGLHIYTYRAFLDALNFYLQIPDISDLFHVRGMALHRVQDKNRRFRRMEEDDSVFVYREGTLDESTHNLYLSTSHNNNNNSITTNGNSNNENGNGNENCNAKGSDYVGFGGGGIRDKGNTTPVGSLVPLKDIIVS
ncbi:hypothetical protein HS088_TW22G00787 [Tripterygium wilfordii]|uniref:Uncharacterized protein n=1 Tax=Tripterygium wilfordii TaxID=458696 RepID=A0A7J7BYW0_TRIWF|nr:homeobox protein 3 [Tripterygium wilfordii]KAF5727100.1 hypothetical protein HS088_TW22G00787 [Tripterygium wilfordii]